MRKDRLITAAVIGFSSLFFTDSIPTRVAASEPIPDESPSKQRIHDLKQYILGGEAIANADGFSEPERAEWTQALELVREMEGNQLTESTVGQLSENLSPSDQQIHDLQQFAKGGKAIADADGLSVKELAELEQTHQVISEMQGVGLGS